MKRLALLLPITLALVLAPTGAFAKDKHKHHDRDRGRDCDRDRRCDDSRYSYRSDSFYPRYDYGRCNDERVYYRPSCPAPSYYSDSDYREYYPAPRSRSARIVIGF